MATPKELVVEVARQTGASEATVILHDRNLAAAGLRSEGRRGRGTSAVTFGDAANLLIAVAGSRNVKDSVKTVQTYGPLEADIALKFDEDGKDVERGQTFADAIATFLEILPVEGSSWHQDNHVKVSLFGPVPTARIEWGIHDGRGGTIEFRVPWSRERIPRSHADLKFVSSFSHITLGYVGELIVG